MKPKNLKLFSAIILALIILVAFPVTAFAASSNDVVIGNSYTLKSGDTLNNDLFVLGGSVDLQSGSTVNGNVTMIGGSVNAAGSINGNLTVLGGTLTMTSTFVLNGNLTYAGTVVNQDPAATIKGQTYTNGNTPYIVLPGGTRIPNLGIITNPIPKVISFFVTLFLWVLVAMLVAMFLPTQLTRISQTVFSQPLLSGGLGLLTVIIVPIVLVLLVLTICLIPGAIIGGVALVAVGVYGLIALGLEVGRRISGIFKAEWHPALAAGLGMLVLMIVLNGMQALIPCVGWIPKFLVTLFAIGAVLLTQFGTKPYLTTRTSTPTSGSGSTQLPESSPKA